MRALLAGPLAVFAMVALLLSLPVSLPLAWPNDPADQAAAAPAGAGLIYLAQPRQ